MDATGWGIDMAAHGLACETVRCGHARRDGVTSWCGVEDKMLMGSRRGGERASMDGMPVLACLCSLSNRTPKSVVLDLS